jgi:hypothetical protein
MIRIVLLGLSILLLQGCGKRTDMQFTAMHKVSQTKEFDAAMIRDALVKAGNKDGWETIVNKDGEIIATYMHSNKRHVAVNTLVYGKTTHGNWYYMINYRDSSVLNYENNHIHKKYKVWTGTLNKNIQAEFQKLNCQVEQIKPKIKS